MLRFLFGSADAGRRAALTVLVAMRWVLIGAALFQVNYRPGSEQAAFALLNGLILAAAALNGILQWRLARPRAIPLWLPVAVGFYDAVAVTGAIALVDGFDNPSYLLYYPALLSFVLVFPGKWSFVYTAAVMVAYTLSAVVRHDSFDPGSTSDQKALVLRLITLATAALTANLVVRVERVRRLEAVAAGERAAEERLAAESRAVEAERRIEDERQRLSREIHDGVSQRAYMLSLGLENARVAAERAGAAELAARLATLHQVSREALFETRNLLFDLGPVMAGEASLAGLARNLAGEFGAVSGIAIEVLADEDLPQPGPAEVGEIFRILQEALANVMKHSGATRAVVRLGAAGGALELRIEDNGRGFAAGAPPRGHGLANMRGRAERLGGECAITSDGFGTVVSVRLPVPRGAA